MVLTQPARTLHTVGRSPGVPHLPPRPQRRQVFLDAAHLCAGTRLRRAPPLAARLVEAGHDCHTPSFSSASSGKLVEAPEFACVHTRLRPHCSTVPLPHAVSAPLQYSEAIMFRQLSVGPSSAKPRSQLFPPRPGAGSFSSERTAHLRPPGCAAVSKNARKRSQQSQQFLKPRGGCCTSCIDAILIHPACHLPSSYHIWRRKAYDACNRLCMPAG